MVVDRGWLSAGDFTSAVALALSSTAIVMTTLAERSLGNTTVGRTSFAILLFQDIAAIPLLVVIPLLAAGGDTTMSWEGPVQGILAVIAVVLLGRYVTPPVIRRVASLHQREVFTACALLLVLGIAQLMAAVGVSIDGERDANFLFSRVIDASHARISTGKSEMPK